MSSSPPPPPRRGPSASDPRHGRRLTLAGRLARLGFADATGSAVALATAPTLAKLAEEDSGVDLLGDLAATADPDAALAGLVRLSEAADDPAALGAELATDPQLRRRLTAVMAVSVALTDFLVRHPQQREVLRGDNHGESADGRGVTATLVHAVGGDPQAAAPVATLSGREGRDALRVAYRRLLLRVAARDVTSSDATAVLPEVGTQLADLAAGALEAALALARADLPRGSASCRLAVVAMGKTGGKELNYLSDVDVIFVAEPAEGEDSTEAMRTASALAAGLMRACSATTAEGSLWEVDAGLRPEGKAGPLVRTLASHLAYYERWARTWEFQALLKARPVAGDQELGRAYQQAVAPLVWNAAARDRFVDDVQAMRRRVEEHVPAAEADRQLKLGRGGLRDVEFAVQLLQLVHGRADESLRAPGTLDALGALSAGGYVARTDAAALDSAYRFLRALEHRIQLHQLRRTALVPEAETDLRRLGRALGFSADPVAELLTARREASREVRRLHEKLFYRPLLGAVARLDPGQARLSPAAAAARLQALGYADPAGALRHLEALTAGLSRRAAIQRTLLPVLLAWFADAVDPDAGLLGFRQVSDALGETSWYLRLLRDEGAVAQRMAAVLASSRYATDLLLRAPEAVGMLASTDELRPRDRQALTTEVLAAVGRHEDDAEAARVARAIRRREMFRIAAADVLYLADEVTVATALSDIAAATVAGALDAATRSVARERGGMAARLSIIGMGRLGGAEMGYASDADVLFVCEPVPGADDREALDAAAAVANELRRTLALPAPDPPLHVDPDLRPEGRQGPLVRTLASYSAYYARWAHVWERQALLRAAPVAGDEELAARFLGLIDPLRYPPEGLDEAGVREIRRIKARVESERLPRGADPSLHLKLGRGGLADVEWTAQLLQLRHAGQLVSLRTTRTIEALRAGADAGLLLPEQAASLQEAWRLASRLRNALLLVRGRPGESLPANVRELAALARLLGHPAGAGGALQEDYRRITRRARAVVEDVFYGR